MKKVNFFANVVGCLLVASNVFADLVPPSRPLHRIGYEIFGSREPQVWQDSEILRLGKEIEDAIRSNDEAKAKALEEKRHGILKVMVDREKEMCARLMNNGGGWKMPQDLTKMERDEFAERIKDIQTELQKAFDAEYATLLAAGKLEWIKLFDEGFSHEYRRERYVREKQAKNARKVIESIMGKNAEMRQKCMGIPIEILTNAMSCPKPDLDPIYSEICPRCKGTGLLTEKTICNACGGYGKVHPRDKDVERLAR